MWFRHLTSMACIYRTSAWNVRSQVQIRTSQVFFLLLSSCIHSSLLPHRQKHRKFGLRHLFPGPALPVLSWWFLSGWSCWTFSFSCSTRDVIDNFVYYLVSMHSSIHVLKDHFPTIKYMMWCSSVKCMMLDNAGSRGHTLMCSYLTLIYLVNWAEVEADFTSSSWSFFSSNKGKNHFLQFHLMHFKTT